ncbi:hypothetical protein M758_9G079300 [Ceratodon purpureus]|uniref:Transmembrane protein 135 N-terminal domain-containing protein n=1 Tax=Ceratodon purpureus TaxID=3225 RepID=A0A8T0GVB9_CERPU|nr:hypothetical protein KC19_9G175000 [Ceratodon purpureus]KAG0605678.1 hypothetical protein M758_9G079300 [Ceratodon purpureus]
MAARSQGLGKVTLAPLVLSAISPEERAARLMMEKTEAEKRLREAETRLREAILELQGKQSEAGEGFREAFSRHSLCPHGDSCVANAVGSLCQSFLLAYGVRVGIGVLLRAFKLVKKKPYYTVLDLKLLLSEKDLIVREEACRTGLLFGGFTGAFHAIRCLLRRTRNKETPINGFVAGSIAGLSVLALDDSNRRRTFALYLLARVAQCAYNSAKAKNKFHFWGSKWGHGDTLLFSLASAQIMYAYVMRPETLPESYFEFIVKTGPIAKPTLQAVRESNRGVPIDLQALSAFVLERSGKPGPPGLKPDSPIIPCSGIHPQTASCLVHNSKAARATFRKTFPLYLSLTFVPFVVLNIQKFMHAPLHTFWNASKSATRSTCFISAFVAIYQGVICLQRKVSTKDHKLVYFFAGAASALSALIEKKSRRSELALYTLPRAGDSLWYILVNRHILPNIKHAEIALFSLCMGFIMYFHEYEPDTMSPFLRGLLTRFLNRTGTPMRSSASYSYLPSVASSDRLAPPSASTSQNDLSGQSSRPPGSPAADGVSQASKDPQKTPERLTIDAFQGL